jgi:hypothetical protein
MERLLGAEKAAFRTPLSSIRNLGVATPTSEIDAHAKPSMLQEI